MFSTPTKIPEDLKFDIKSLKEEKLNMFSHLLGVIFWFFVAPFFLYNSFSKENPLIIIGLLVYIFSFLMLFSASTLYHSSYVARTRNFFRKLDHIGIYIFIAGTYTPIILLYINNVNGHYVLYGLWFATVFGTVYKMFFIGKFRIISTIIYLLMGWAAVFIIKELQLVMPSEIFNWIMAGGIIYTIGTVFYINKKLKYNHFIWHLFVLGGAICHFIGIYQSI